MALTQKLIRHNLGAVRPARTFLPLHIVQIPGQRFPPNGHTDAIADSILYKLRFVGHPRQFLVNFFVRLCRFPSTAAPGTGHKAGQQHTQRQHRSSGPFHRAPSGDQGQTSTQRFPPAAHGRSRA